MPRKPAEPTLTVSFRLTAPDPAAYLAKAKAAGVQPSSDKRRLVYLFNKASNNLNQVAHTANAAELAGTAGSRTKYGDCAQGMSANMP